jgi:hypothetical protein
LANSRDDLPELASPDWFHETFVVGVEEVKLFWLQMISG